jgi:hypothetical protein
MATVSLIDPYSQQAEEIARRQRMAQALQQQGSQVLDMPTTPGVLISPYAGLAKVLESGLGAYQEKKAQKDYTALQDKYRTNYNTQLGEMARLISAPEVKGVAGQEFVADVPASTRSLGLGFGGDELTEEVAAIPGQPAIAPVEARPAGYIGAAELEKFDIPEVKQLLMAKYLKQFEPERVTLSDNQRLLERTGGGGFKEVVGAAKTPTTATLSPLGKLQSERAAIAATNPNDPRLAIYDNAIAKESQDQNLVFQREKFEYEKGNPGFTLEKVKNVDGSESVMAVNKGSAVARPVVGADGKALTSAAPSKKVRLEVTAEDGSTKTLLLDETDPRFAEGFAIRGPDYVSITEVNPQGQTVVRQVKKDDAILKTGYVKPLEGFLGQLQAAGVPMDKIRSDPKIMDLVNRYFVKTAGGVAPEDVFGSELRKAEVVARLGELGIAIPANIKGLSLSVTPGPLGGAQSTSAAAPTPASAALQMPANKNQLVNGQTYQTPKGEMKWNAAANRFEK